MESAMEKQGKDGLSRGLAIVLTLRVDFGDALVIQGSSYHMTSDILKGHGCQSVKGRKAYTSKWEFVVYDSSRILEFVNIQCANPDPQTYATQMAVLRDMLQRIQDPHRAWIDGSEVGLLHPGKVNATAEFIGGRAVINVRSKTGEPIELTGITVRNGACVHLGP
jgi:hypothetical protein